MTDFVTNSLLKTFQRCPRQAMYKYHDSLIPRSMGKALRRGTWFHELMDVFYTMGGYSDDTMDAVRQRHRELKSEFDKLMDEEKDALGDLPRELWRLLIAYLWHYRKDQMWEVIQSEIKLEGELPNGITIQGKADILIEDEFGVGLVDHKTHKIIPSLIERILDRQSILYLWLATENGYGDVSRFTWNYVKTEAPPKVRFTKGTKNFPSRMVKNQAETDYWTALKSIQREHPEQLSSPEVTAYLNVLKGKRYDPRLGVQTSPFFIRDSMDKDTAMITRALAETMHTAERFMDYPFEDRDAVERVRDRSCNWCSFRNLCTAELIGGNGENVKRQEFTVGDPFGYYEDRIGTTQT